MVPQSVYLDRIGVALGSRCVTLEESAAAGRLVTPPAELRAAGFGSHHLCAPDETALDLALAAVRESDRNARDAAAPVDAILYATALPDNENLGDRAGFERTGDVKALMEFPATRLQAALGLEGALVLGVSQQACTGLLGAVRVGRALLLAEPDRQRLLCVTSDRFPRGARYEQAFNVISDGAASCVLSRERGGFRVLACHALTNGALAQADDDETVGVFFGYAARAIAAVLEAARATAADIDWIVPQNTHEKAWPVLARLTGLCNARIYCPTRAEIGHLISGDNLLNLRRLQAARICRPGDKLLLLMAGFGLHVQALVLEAV